MSADLDTQHFGQPEEPGTPGVAKYRKARAALAAYDALDAKSTFLHLAKVADDLNSALQALMPTYRVMESIPGAGRRTAAKDLPDIPAAQQWIADNDPAARRVFEIEVQR